MSQTEQILRFTEAARKAVRARIAEEGGGQLCVRVAVSFGSTPFVPQYELALEPDDSRAVGDIICDVAGFQVVVDPSSARYLDGTVIDYVERPGEAGFEFRNRNAQALQVALQEGPLAFRIEQVLDQVVNSTIAAHGGRVMLVEVRDNVAYVRMSGGCQGCGLAALTLREGVERTIKQAIPEIDRKSVV